MPNRMGFRLDRYGGFPSGGRPAAACDSGVRSGLPFAAVDPDRLSVEVEAGVEAALVVLHGSPDETSIDVRLAEGASLA